MSPKPDGLARRTLLVALAAAPVSAALARPAQAANPGSGSLTSLGTPLSDVLLIGGTVAPYDDGRQVLWVASSGTPAHLNAIDPTTGSAVLSLELPGASGSYAVRASPDGSIYVGTYSNGHLYRRRTGKSTVEDLGQVSPGDTYIEALAIDETGIVYGGTIYGGKVFAYDPSTGSVRDYGQMVPGIQYIQTLTCADGVVYVGTGQVGHLLALDPVSGTTREIPLPQATNPAINGVYNLNAYDGFLYARVGAATSAPMAVYDLASAIFTDFIPAVAGLDVAPPDEQGRVYFTTVGPNYTGALVAYDPVSKVQTPVGLGFVGRVVNNRGIGWAQLDDPAWPGQTLVGMLWKGQEFRFNPTTGASDLRDTDVRREPIPIQSLAADPAGPVWAGGFLSGGLSKVDAVSGAATFHRFAQIESILPASDGTVWIGTYPSARLYHYNPAATWSSPEYDPGPPGTPENPVKVLDLTTEHQNRLKALALCDDKLYVGTAGDLTQLQSVLAEYDPATGTSTLYRDVVSDESIVSLDSSGRLLFGGTSIYNSYTQPTPTQDAGRVFCWDPRAARLSWQLTPVAGAPQVNVVAAFGGIWGVADGTVFAVDPDRRAVVRTIALRAATGSTAQQIVVHQGKLYVLVDGRFLYRVDRQGRTQLLLEQSASRLASHVNGSLYLGDDLTLFRYQLGG